MNVRKDILLLACVFCGGCVFTNVEYSVEENNGEEYFTSCNGATPRKCLSFIRHYKFARRFPFPDYGPVFFKSDGCLLFELTLRTIIDVVTFPLYFIISKDVEEDDATVVDLGLGVWKNPHVYKLVVSGPCRKEGNGESWVCVICKKILLDGKQVEFMQRWEGVESRKYPTDLFMRIYKTVNEYEDVPLGFGCNGYNTWLIDDDDVLYVLKTHVVISSKKLFGIFECNSNRYWEGDLIKKVCVQSLKVETIVRYCYGDIITAESGGVGDKKEVRCISPETP